MSKPNKPLRALALDPKDPTFMTQFLKQKNPQSADETFLLRQLHSKVHKQGKTELIDFSSSTLVQVRDGNTLSDSAFVRRGLSHL